MINNTIFNIMFTIVPILVLCGFIFTFAMVLSPKLRAKVLRKQLEAQKHIYDENEDLLRELNIKGANIQKDGITIKTRAVRDGLFGENVYCSSCGAQIDADSKFCKICGKKQ